MKENEIINEYTPILLHPDYKEPKGSVFSIIPSFSLTNNNNNSNNKINKKESSFKETKLKLNRVVDRDGAFSQSRGKLNIRKIIHQRELTLLYVDDLFHTLVDAPTPRTILILLSIYIFIICIYTIIYYFLSEVFDCSLKIVNLIEAFFFSLETMATIGYGTEDIFFKDSWIMAFVLTSQICVKIIADAITIGVIYCRISRPNKRAATIVFSHHAIIKRINERLFFTFRVCELRKHQLVEAHIRCYAIRHERDCETGEVIPFKSHSMRLNHPNDELGGMLLLCFPQEILHELDAWSPLMPQPIWGSNDGVYHWHPPTFAHARINTNRSSISSDPVEDSYDPDLYTSWPGISRRTASEDPGGLWRKRFSNKVDCTNGNNSINNTPQKKAHTKHRKKRISLGITRHVDKGKSHQDYLEMLRTLAEAASTSSHSPNSSHKISNNDGTLLSDGLQGDSYFNLTASSIHDHHHHDNSNSDNDGNNNYDKNNNKNNDNDDNNNQDYHLEQSFHPFESLSNNTVLSSSPLSPTSQSLSKQPFQKEFSQHPLPLPSPSPSQQKQQPNLIKLPSSSFSTSNDQNKFQFRHDKYNNIEWKNEEMNMVNRFIDDRNIEIIVLIEGQDSTTGGVVQARHSYKYDDILWNTSFLPCVSQDELDGAPIIDFRLFHLTELTAYQNEDHKDDLESCHDNNNNNTTNNNNSYNTFTKSYQNDSYSSYGSERV